MSEAWETLRKKARTTENLIDVKLVALNKLTGGSNNSYDDDQNATFARQTSFGTITEDLDGLLRNLTGINDEMTDLVSAPSSSTWALSPAVQHTVKRHREILRDYSSEYHRAKDNVNHVLQREMLLSGSTSSQSQGLNNRGRSYDVYMKEHEHISSCDRLLDEQMEMALSTKENLARQGINLRGISSRIQHLTKRFPQLNGLMQKIQSKKRKNTLVLAGTISACLIFTIYWIIS